MKTRRGFIFVVTLVVVMVVSLIALVVLRQAAVRMRWSKGDVSQIQARMAALGMMEAVVADLQNQVDNGQFPRLQDINPRGEDIGECVVVLLGRDPEGLRQYFDVIPMGARLSVNSASFDELLALPDMKRDLVASIIDWRDTDAEVHPEGGAEQLAYVHEDVPYIPHDGEFEALEELRWVRGIDDSLYMGEDDNQNGLLDEGEDSDGDGQLDRGLRDVLALDVREPLLSPDGSTRQAVWASRRRVSHPLLAMLYGDERSKEMMETIRQNTPQDKSVITGRMAVGHLAGMTEEERSKLYIYGLEPEGRVGLVDAWYAPEEVLATVVGSSLAAQIVAARPANPPEDLEWVSDLMTPTQMMSEGQRLTTGAWQVMLDILAIQKDGTGYVRLHVLIDFSVRKVRIHSIRDMTTLGWPCPWAPLEDLRTTGDAGAFLSKLTGGSL